MGWKSPVFSINVLQGEIFHELLVDRLDTSLSYPLDHSKWKISIQQMRRQRQAKKKKKIQALKNGLLPFKIDSPHLYFLVNLSLVR